MKSIGVLKHLQKHVNQIYLRMQIFQKSLLLHFNKELQHCQKPPTLLQLILLHNLPDHIPQSLFVFSLVILYFVDVIQNIFIDMCVDELKIFYGTLKKEFRDHSQILKMIQFLVRWENLRYKANWVFHYKHANKVQKLTEII